MSVDWSALAPGDERHFVVEDLKRFHFVRYAGASGETVARAAGLESVFGQGMFTAGVLSRLPAEWFGPESIRRYAVRFRKRVWPGDSIVCRGRVTRVYDEGGVPHADLALTARNQKDEVLVRGEATVRPWRPGTP